MEDGKWNGSNNWYDFDEKELRIFFVVFFYIGMKRQPNAKSYWEILEKLFYCLVFANLRTQRQFLALQKCLHLTPSNEAAIENYSPCYDEIHQC